MAGWDFASVYEAISRVFPDRVALIHGDDRRTWAELDANASALAAGLEAAGLRPGDVAADYLRNGPEYIETFYAASKPALAPMNTNFRGPGCWTGWDRQRRRRSRGRCRAGNLRVVDEHVDPAELRHGRPGQVVRIARVRRRWVSCGSSGWPRPLPAADFYLKV